jgi:uncharacterized membrane protein
MKNKIHILEDYSQALFVSLLMLAAFSSCTRQPVYPKPPKRGPEVVIDARGIQPEIPTFFSYKCRDKRITFFVLKIEDRVPSFLDACMSCYPKKLGYKFTDRRLTCRACGMEYSVFQIEKGLENCFPIRIEGRLQNGEYRISRSALEIAADRF